MEKTIRDALNERVITESGVFFGVERSEILTLGGFENFVFEYKQYKSSYILRLVHSSHRKLSDVQAELEFIDHLYKNGASVSNVVRSINGKFIEKVVDDFGGYFSVCVFEKAPGTFVKRTEISDTMYNNLGIEVAKLHTITKSYIPKTRRYSWDEEDWIDIGRRNLSKEDMSIIDIAIKHVEKIKKYNTTENDFGLIHTDLHFGNMYLDNGTFTFFDFDDSAYKHFISDIAIIIFYSFGLGTDSDNVIESKTKNFLTHFMRGYTTLNHLDYVWFERLNDFLKLRELVLYIVLHAAGEEVINSAWFINFKNKFRTRIMNDVPFFNLDNVLDKTLWNS